MSDQWQGNIDAWKVKRNLAIRRVHIECTEEVTRSVVDGSELTGSPGQPIILGALRGSYVPSWITPTTWRLASALVYAPIIETLEGPYGAITIRSPSATGQRGGHSVAKTRTGWPNIVRVVGERNRAT